MKHIEKNVVSLNFAPKGKIIPLNQVDTDKKNLYTDKCGEESLEDSVYMSPESYKLIFGKKRSDDKLCRRRLAVVKIYSPITHQSIYRKYVYCPEFSGLDDTNLALHPSSIRELGENEKIVGRPVYVSPGSVLAYYWMHPFHATRISAKLGVLSILLAIVSIVLTIVLSCNCC